MKCEYCPDCDCAEHRMATRAQEHQIDLLLIRAYKESQLNCRPLYPWVLVRVLPREQERGGLILPGGQQNKTVHEGLVLATWDSHWKFIGKTNVFRVPTVSVGDHVLFNHFAGVPLDGGSKDTKYRFVKDTEFSYSEGGVLAVVDRDESDDASLSTITDFVWGQQAMLTKTEVGKIVEQMMLQWEFISKTRTSVTLSGR